MDSYISQLSPDLGNLSDWFLRIKFNPKGPPFLRLLSASGASAISHIARMLTQRAGRLTPHQPAKAPLEFEASPGFYSNSASIAYWIVKRLFNSCAISGCRKPPLSTETNV